jgi:hypothetical protein
MSALAGALRAHAVGERSRAAVARERPQCAWLVMAPGRPRSCVVERHEARLRRRTAVGHGGERAGGARVHPRRASLRTAGEGATTGLRGRHGAWR